MTIITLELNGDYFFSECFMPRFSEDFSFKSGIDREYKPSESSSHSHWVEGEFLSTVR